MTWSIRARLTTWYSLVVVAVLTAGTIAVALAQSELAIVRLDGELQRLLLTVEGVMRTELNEGLDLQASATEASAEVVAPDRHLVLARPNGALLASWGHPLPAPWIPSASSTAPVFDTLRIDGARLRAVHRTFSHRGESYLAAAIAPLEPIEREHAELLASLAIGAAVALLVAAAGGWVVGRQTLKPLGDMASQATAIGDRDPATRLVAPHPDDELGQLAAAFNALLDRLAAALHAQRQFMADASHELRTPVSVVRTTADVTLRRDNRPEPEYRDALSIVAERSAHLARLVDAMFLLSRAEAQGLPLRREALYLDDLLSESARALRVLAGQRGVRVDLTGAPEVAFFGDDSLLRQMIGNLLDNAIRHAAPGGHVTATLEATHDEASIRICDDGPGIAPENHERIFQRFVRLDPISDGAGLGLPIARWIAEAHGGTLILESSAGAGASFLVSLPRDSDGLVPRTTDRSALRTVPVSSNCHRPFI